MHLLTVLALELIPHIDEALLNYLEFLGFLLQQALSLRSVLLLQVFHFFLVLLNQELRLHHQFLLASVIVLGLNCLLRFFYLFL